MYEDTSCFVSGTTVVGGGEDSEEAAMLLDLETCRLALVSSNHVR